MPSMGHCMGQYAVWHMASLATLSMAFFSCPSYLIPWWCCPLARTGTTPVVVDDDKVVDACQTQCTVPTVVSSKRFPTLVSSKIQSHHAIWYMSMDVCIHNILGKVVFQNIVRWSEVVFFWAHRYNGKLQRHKACGVLWPSTWWQEIGPCRNGAVFGPHTADCWELPVLVYRRKGQRKKWCATALQRYVSLIAFGFGWTKIATETRIGNYFKTLNPAVWQTRAFCSVWSVLKCF